MKAPNLLLNLLIVVLLMNCTNSQQSSSSEDEQAAETAQWTVDFFDDFESFNTDNWQDQRIWVNNENHCYVPDGEYGTREVSDGTLKLKVVKICRIVELIFVKSEKLSK